MQPTGRTAARLLLAPLAAFVAAGLAVPSASAASGGDYGTWSAAGPSGTLTTAVTGFPAATFTTTSSAVATPTGASTFLGPSTPFGAKFGSSRGRNYLMVRTARGGAPSVTTLDFASPTPAGGWGFNLGDIDADHVRITGTGPTGRPIPTQDLGYAGPFNYCAAVPRPGSCTRPPFTDLPTWDARTATLVGSGRDTDGASGWFTPTVPVKSISFTFSVQTGIPIGQIWTAAVDRSITGRVRLEDGAPPPRTKLRLLDSKGRPVRDARGRPVTTLSDDQGHYSFPNIAVGDYRVQMAVPKNFTAAGTTRRSANVVRRDATGVDFFLTHADSPAPDTRARETVPVRGTVTEIVLPPVNGQPATDAEISDPPAHGTAVLTGHGTIRYTPAPGFTGRDTFTYIAYNRDGDELVETVTLDVKARMAASGASVDPSGPAAVGTGLLVAGAGLVLAARRRAARAQR